MASAVPKPGEFFGHFRLLEQIGAGGMGVVFRARDQRLERDVAIKILQPRAGSDETARKRFHREALILSRLNHPNIEAIYDFQSEDGVDYLVMEYVPGVSLDDRVHAGALPHGEVVSLGIQLARGLSAAHAQDIIHRDLKPGNLRVTADHTLKILDFGLAQLFVLPEQGALAETATILPSFSGTLPYLAPEQLKGDEPSVRSDIYSAGVVLYELATGVRPFPQQGSMLWDAIIHSLPVSPRAANKEFSPELEAVILTCLEKDPGLRYRSAAELQSDLERIAAGEKVTATNERLQAAAGAKRKRRLGLLFAACLVLALAIVLLIWKWPVPPPKAEQKIMAVLPIETLGQDPDTNALGLGLTETLTAKLVQASDSDFIQVVSARDLRDKGVKTSEDARREFGTNLVLESSLQRSGNTVRINCSLVDSKTHRQLAAKTIEAKVTDAFGLQDKIVSAALDMLPTQINPEQRNQLAARPDTKPAAYEAYVRGRGYLQEYEKPENIDNAIAEFNQALKIDPNYAPAYAGLGEAYWIGYQQLNRGKQWLDQASSACEKALALGKQLSDAHACMGNVYVAKGQYGPAAAEFSRAVELNPDSDGALIGLADAYQKLGKLTEAEGTYKKAISLRPKYWGVYSWLGTFYYSQARYADAIRMFRKTTELAPDNYRGYSNLAGLYNLQGNYGEAIQQSNRSIALRPTADAYTNLGNAYFSLRKFADAAEAFRQASELGDKNWVNWGNLGDALYWTPGSQSQAAAAYRKAISLAKAQLEINPKDFTAWVMAANYYAMLDDKKNAYENLQKGLAIAPPDPDICFRAAIIYNHFGDSNRAVDFLKKAIAGGTSRATILNQPDFDSLKQTPEFRTALGI